MRWSYTRDYFAPAKFSTMETTTTAAKVNIPTEADFDKSFKPKGAIAFFLLLVLLGLIIWFGIYFLMLSRV